MKTIAVLATGPSMSQDIADSVRGLTTIAVSDAYRLAPWADVLVSSDKPWWRINDPDFKGRKISGVPIPGIEQFQGNVSGSNSGLIAIKVAVEMGARRILLLGYDMGGSHFFGSHPAPLKNTSLERFEIFKKQFAQYQPKGVEILNCTPDSALTCYPTADLGKVLESMVEPTVHAA